VEFFKIISIIFFLLSYLLISLEHKIKVNKSAISLFTAGFLWVVVGLTLKSKEKIIHNLEIAGSEIFNIVIFLLAAMTLVEILINYNFFDLIRLNLIKLKLKDKFQFIIIGIITFFLSALLDNLTISIVMTQIARRFFKKNNLLIAASGIIILANAGGAWSPLGDVTTIMIWLSGKFSTFDVIRWGILPSLVFGLISILFLSKKIQSNSQDIIEKNNNITLTRGEKLVIFTTLISFIFPLLMNQFGLQPYIGLLFGLGLVWIIIELLQLKSQVKTHLEGDIDKLVKKIDISTLKFFIGILLSISALNTLGILENLSIILFGHEQQINRIITGNIILGVLSSIIDNVPLTAIAIDIIKTTDSRLWVLLALTVGTGGSFSLVGSVAGVVVMGIIKRLNFANYFRIAFLPVFFSYISLVIIWLIQYFLLD